MAKVVYKSYNRNEGSLFPVYLSDMVSAEHPARVKSQELPTTTEPTIAGLTKTCETNAA